MNITRSEAARLIEEIREIVTAGDSIQVVEIRRVLERRSIIPLIKCTNKAHSNLFFDNCSLCAPRWGWTGEPVKVR